MPSKYTTRLERFGTALWIRRVAVLILGGILAGNLVVITYAWAQHPGIGGGRILLLLLFLSAAGFYILFRLWTVASGSPAASGGSHSSDNATSSSQRQPRP